MGLKLKNILNNIKNRQYDIVRDINKGVIVQTPKHRIEHIESKGYTRVKHDSVISNINKQVCLECNGTGELDFFFYKRFCSCKLKG